MKYINRIMSLLLMAAMVLGMTGCSNGDVSYAMEINGEKMMPGVYVGYLTQAFLEGYQKLSTTTSADDIWARTVDDVPFEDWIKEEALNSIKRNEGAKVLAEQMNISLSEEELDDVKSTLDYAWESVGELYEKSGCSYNSALTIYQDNYLAQKVFLATYGPDGTNPVSDEELKSVFNSYYANVSVISLNYYDADGARVDDAEIKARDAHFEEMIQRIDAGEDYNQLLIEHGRWINETYNSDSFDESTFDPEENFTIIYKDDSSISDVLRDSAFSCEIGHAVTLNQDPTVYLIYRKALPDDAETLDEYRQSLLTLSKQNEFEETCLKRSEEITITLNEEAVSYYSPRNIEYSTIL